jgi:Holliday junction resolvase RusA-like endonuclease
VAGVRIVTEVFVPNRPRTKGSLEVVSARGPKCRCSPECRGFLPARRAATVRESVDGSSTWRQQVAYMVRADRARRGLTEPSVGPVGVRALFYLAPLGDGHDELGPIELGSGDTDKLARNIGDALADAGAYVNDVQVVSFWADKVHADESHPEGCRLMVWEVPTWHLRLRAEW